MATAISWPLQLRKQKRQRSRTSNQRMRTSVADTTHHMELTCEQIRSAKERPTTTGKEALHLSLVEGMLRYVKRVLNQGALELDKPFEERIRAFVPDEEGEKILEAIDELRDKLDEHIEDAELRNSIDALEWVPKPKPKKKD